jgi:hypothetical protein
MKSICPSEAEVMAEWGHVRRGYTLDELKNLIGLPCQNYATFIQSSHRFFVMMLPSHAYLSVKRQLLCTMLSPLTWLSYSLHRPEAKGHRNCISLAIVNIT